MSAAMRPTSSAPVIIVDYDERWPQMFRAEAALIQGAIGRWLAAIEHVGSTAVPGLAAKPVIDIMPGLRSLADAPEIIGPMEAIGYEYVPEFEAVLPERRYFVKPAGEEGRRQRLYHVHVVEATSHFWKRTVAFRDYLRADPDAAQDYARLKRRLSEEYRDDRHGYTDAKTEFITRIERLALDGEQ
jgi:GrpB-like predicted nucleotidyltransferase (UPF0157 family)